MSQVDLFERLRKEGEDWGVVKGIFWCLGVEAVTYLGLQFVLWGIGA